MMNEIDTIARSLRDSCSWAWSLLEDDRRFHAGIACAMGLIRPLFDLSSRGLDLWIECKSEESYPLLYENTNKESLSVTMKNAVFEFNQKLGKRMRRLSADFRVTWSDVQRQDPLEYKEKKRY